MKQYIELLYETPLFRNINQADMGRMELADYLGADRSALSRELSRMKGEGLIDYNKNTFRLYQSLDQ